MVAMYRKNQDWDILLIKVEKEQGKNNKSIKEKILGEIQKVHRAALLDIIQLDVVKTTDSTIEYSVGFMYQETAAA